MDCGSKGCRFESYFLPVNFFSIFNFFNKFKYNCFFFRFDVLTSFFIYNHFWYNYFSLNELIWQEGLLIDFLQKKITDNWLRKFVIYSANLFNERLVFDRVIRFYLDLLIWPMHKFFIFEFNNVSGTLFINLFFFFFFFFIFVFFYFLLFMF